MTFTIPIFVFQVLGLACLVCFLIFLVMLIMQGSKSAQDRDIDAANWRHLKSFERATARTQKRINYESE